MKQAEETTNPDRKKHKPQAYEKQINQSSLQRRSNHDARQDPSDTKLRI